MALNSAPIEWAQRTESVYFTIKLPDCKDAKIELEANTLKFRCGATHTTRAAEPLTPI
jgi:hypothetical protein